MKKISVNMLSIANIVKGQGVESAYNELIELLNKYGKKSLNVYIEKYKPEYSIRMSSKNFGYDDEKKIKSIPLYAIFCLKEI